MMKRISQRVAFATLILVVAIAGAAVAAGTITGKDIKNGSVTGKDVKNRSLTTKDFKGSVRGPAGPAGPAGLAGPRGAQGLQGKPGAAGPTALHYASDVLTLDPSVTDDIAVLCPAGYYPAGGGASSDDMSDTFITVAESGFFDDGTDLGWFVAARNTDAANAHQVFVDVACVRPTQVSASGPSAAKVAAAARKAAR